MKPKQKALLEKVQTHYPFKQPLSIYSMGISGRPEEQEQKAFFACLRGEFAEELGHDEQFDVYRAVIVATADFVDIHARKNSQGHRVSKQMQKMKRMGYQSGTPDMIFLIKRGEYSGLVIEMKSPKGCATKSQKATLAFLRTQGFSCHVCNGFAAALDVFITYIKF